jgi:hypothetical protein
MAAPPIGPPSKTIYEIDIIHVKPKYLLQYVQCIPQGISIVQKHGCKVLGYWMVEGGSANGPEIVFMSQSESLDARHARVEKCLQDPEFIKFIQTRGRCIYGVENYLCLNVPAIPCSAPNPNAKLLLETIKCKCFPVLTVGKMMEMYQMWEKYVGPNGPKPVGLFRPLAYSKPCIIGMFPSGPDGKFDGLFETYGKMVTDPINWPKLGEIYEKMDEQSCRILCPIRMDLLPKAEECKIQ